MKNLLLTLFTLIAISSYAQNVENEWSHKIFNTTDDKKIQLIIDNTSPELLTIFKEIKALKLVEPTNNSEGKFSTYANPFSSSIKSNTKTSIIKKRIASIDIKDNEAFIDDIIFKLTSKSNINSKDPLAYADRIIMYYKKNTTPKNKLNATLFKNANVEIQIGKNIYNYIYKLHKSEFDLDLKTSLNLLVVNF